MSNNDLLEQCNSDYETFSEYRTQLLEGEQKVSEGLDKAVLAISSAALGLTFTLFKTFYISGSESSLTYIKYSWLFLGISMSCVIISLLLSGHLYFQNRKQTDKILANRAAVIACIQDQSESQPEVEDFQERSLFQNIIRIVHYSGAIALIIGVLLFGLFVNENLGENSVNSANSNKAKTDILREGPRKVPSPTSAPSTEKTTK